MDPATVPPRDAARGGAPFLAALATLLLLAPTLARSPQSGDGAEIVNVALRGGVLHPPGFPLQAWIDRALVAIPGANPATAIAALGLVCHAAAAGLIAATLARLGAGATGALAGAAAFAFFPSAWRLAVEPEVFAPAHFFVALLVFLAVRGGRGASAPATKTKARSTPAPATPAPQAATLAEPALAGLAGGLAAGTHPVVVAAVPALAVAIARAVRPGPRRGARVTIAAATLVLPAAALFLSLPLLRGASPWPDWGSLRTPADVLRHALRIEYGGLAMSAASAGATATGLARWAADVARVWSAGALFALAGALVLRGRGGARAVVAVLGTLAAALAILVRARLPEQSYTASELERLEGPAVLAAAVLLGLGVDAARRRLAGRGMRSALDVLVALAVAAWLVSGWRGADAAHDATLALHQQGVAAELGDAVYVTEGDLETFAGVPARPGARRFPVMGPEIALDWYWRDVAPRLEPRVLRAGDPPPASWDAFLAACFAHGLAVAGTSRAVVMSDSLVPELRGLVYVARPGGAHAFTPATIAAAARLVPLAARLPVLPPGRRELSRFYERRFARAFSGAGEALRERGDFPAAATADSVAGAILRGLPVAERRARLDAFVRAAGGSR